MMLTTPVPMVEWRRFAKPQPYLETVARMEAQVDAIVQGRAKEALWLLEHPPLYTAGSSANPSDLLQASLPVYSSGRGGQYTYHGPGQRVVYTMLNLQPRGRDVRCFVRDLEQWLITVLAEWSVTAFTRQGRVGVWVETPRGDEKIAAIGIRVRRWVTFHGLALNVAPNLDHFRDIVPCGLPHYGVTSLAALGVTVRLEEVDAALRRHCPFWSEPLGCQTEDDA
jgi:lipoyl(octanoyl) transferase